MTASTRFLGFAVLAWAGVRAISLGVIPVGGGAIASALPGARGQAPLPPIGMTEFAPLDPVSAEPAGLPSESGGGPAAQMPGTQMYAPQVSAEPSAVPRYPEPRYPLPHYPQAQMAYAMPGYYPVNSRRAQSRARIRYVDVLMPEPRRLPFTGESAAPGLPQFKLASAAAIMPSGHADPQWSNPIAALLATRAKRLDLSVWVMSRGKPGQILGPNSLAANSATLGEARPARG